MTPICDNWNQPECEYPKDNLQAGGTRVIPSDFFHIPRSTKYKAKHPWSDQSIIFQIEKSDVRLHRGSCHLRRRVIPDHPWPARFPLFPVCHLDEHREAKSGILTATEKLCSFSCLRNPIDENFRKITLPHIFWKAGPEDWEEYGILVISGLRARLVKEEISWIEGPGKLLEDLIDMYVCT